MNKSFIAGCAILALSVQMLWAQSSSFAEKQIRDFPQAYKSLQKKIDEIREECKVVTKKGEDGRNFFKKHQRLLATTGALGLSSVVMYAGHKVYVFYSKKAISDPTSLAMKNSGKYAAYKNTGIVLRGLGFVGTIVGAVVSLTVANSGQHDNPDSIDKVVFIPKLFGAEILNMNPIAVDSLVRENITHSTPIYELIEQAETLLDLCETMNKK